MTKEHLEISDFVDFVDKSHMYFRVSNGSVGYGEKHNEIEIDPTLDDGLIYRSLVSCFIDYYCDNIRGHDLDLHKRYWITDTFYEQNKDKIHEVLDDKLGMNTTDSKQYKLNFGDIDYEV